MGVEAQRSCGRTRPASQLKNFGVRVLIIDRARQQAVTAIFIGGSRQVLRLPAEVQQRLDNVVARGHPVVIGDAVGADKAVQRHLLERGYGAVTVYCSGGTPRNNLGNWRTHPVDAPDARGFPFHAAKDREMAREADFGLMIWDGRSPGAVLNVMRLALAGKIAVLFNVTEQEVINIRTWEAWTTFISACSHEVQSAVKDRATAAGMAAHGAGPTVKPAWRRRTAQRPV
jgi:hypothetical protein